MFNTGSRAGAQVRFRIGEKSEQLIDPFVADAFQAPLFDAAEALLPGVADDRRARPTRFAKEAAEGQRAQAGRVKELGELQLAHVDPCALDVQRGNETVQTKEHLRTAGGQGDLWCQAVTLLGDEVTVL